MKMTALEKRIKEDAELFEKSTLPGYFDDQLRLIKDPVFNRCITNYLFEKVKPFVFKKPTSSTGKYHPSYQNGEVGNGLHTKNVVKILQVFERAYPDQMWDAIYAAAILHDSTKYETEESKYTDGKHALTASAKFEEYFKSFLKEEKSILEPKEVRKLKKYGKMTVRCIKWHDGRFNPLNATKDQIKENYTKKFYKNVRYSECHLMHLADMISASKPLYEEVF